MTNIMDVVMVIVTILMTIIGIDFIIKHFFDSLYGYRKKTNDDAIDAIGKVFDKMPDLMFKTVKSIMELEEKKEKDYGRIKFEEEKDIDNVDWSVKD